MTIIKVSEALGPSLNWLVSKAIGEYKPTDVPKYSTDWMHGGPIIDREGMHVDCLRQGKKSIWEAWPYETGTRHIQQGPTPLIAAMRCYVVSKLGDTVDVPTELLK